MAKKQPTPKDKEKKTFKQRQDEIFQAVTERILEELSKGVIPWRKPWRNLGSALDPSLCAVSYEKGTPYSLLNQIILGKPGEWLTFNVIQRHGGRIKKGEKSSMVVFADRLVKEDPEKLDEDGKPTIHVIPYLKYYRVWHLDQTEGIESRLPKPGEKPEQSKVPVVTAAEDIVAGYLSQPSHPHLEVRTTNQAYYSPLSDTVVVPRMEQYGEPAEYYSTLFHELGHSTGHRSRLARKGVVSSDGFGRHEYSKEELIAEMTAAMLLAQAGIDSENVLRNNAGYIQAWNKKAKEDEEIAKWSAAIQDDNKMVVWAAAGAEKAAKWILGIKEERSARPEAEGAAAETTETMMAA